MIDLDTEGVTGYGVLANFHGYAVMRLSDYEDAKTHGFDMHENTLIAPDKLWVEIEKKLFDELQQQINEKAREVFRDIPKRYGNGSQSRKSIEYKEDV